MNFLKNAYSKAKKAGVKAVAAVGAVVATTSTAMAGVVTTALTGNTVSADITEAGAFIIGLAVVALGIRWTKATFF